MWFDHSVLVIAMLGVLIWLFSLFYAPTPTFAPTNRPGFSKYFPGDPGFHCADAPDRCGVRWRNF